MKIKGTRYREPLQVFSYKLGVAFDLLLGA
jgi:hypothetical protein